MPSRRPLDHIIPGRSESIANSICVLPPFGCGGPAHTFHDPLSKKEYMISGLCQKCQDQIFGI